MSSCKRKTLRGSKFQWAMCGLPLSGAIICVLDRLKTSQRKGIVVSIPNRNKAQPSCFPCRLRQFVGQQKSQSHT